MKKVLNEIIEKIKEINENRIKNGENLICNDDTNEEILEILSIYFIEELQHGEDIDGFELLERVFGSDYQRIRDAECGLY